ncbi:MAG: pyridoxal phosphate-dependent aminotransferase [Oscillospiraceae bacterium]|jgi:cystathionine beta-lyase|nr:pyridoxal phosphate-dependent aminotransferase [Oscillospiraceae bacterium]
MTYNFDEQINRYGTDSIKYEPEKRGRSASVLPMWVADMDFRAPPFVLDALHRRVVHGIFGYSEPGGEYYGAVREWFRSRFDWTVEPETVTLTFGVVNAVNLAVRAFTAEGDGVIIQQPVYYPFESAVRDNRRTLLVNELVMERGRYVMDLDDFAEKAKRAKLFILCSPHNPVGRVWTREELRAVGEICLRNGVTVISDEIHADFVYAPHRHTVFETLSPELREITVTCTAPSKTFNLAGLAISNIMIGNEELRRAFRAEYNAAGLSQPSLLGFAACQSAYSPEGAVWLKQLLAYLEGNIALMREFLRDRVGEVKLVEPEGTYLLWLDCRALGERNVSAFMEKRAELWLDGGEMFGESGRGYQRVNIACPRSTLSLALARLESAVRARRG